MKSLIAADARKRDKEREKAEKEAARLRKLEERERRKKAGKVGRPSHGFELSRPSFWHRYDKWVTRIGDRIAFRIDDITNWLMTAAIWVAIIWAVVAVIAIWIYEGLFVAIIVVIIGAALIGILEGVAGILAAVVKYVSYVPLYIVRIFFYRGWTLLLAVSTGCGYLIYLLLKAMFLA